MNHKRPRGNKCPAILVFCLILNIEVLQQGWQNMLGFYESWQQMVLCNTYYPDFQYPERGLGLGDEFGISW